jgi:hypothetical protein
MIPRCNKYDYDYDYDLSGFTEMLLRVGRRYASGLNVIMVVQNRLNTNNAQDMRRLQQQSKMTKINKVVQADRRLTIRETSNALNISCGSVKLVLTNNLNMRQVSAKLFHDICHKNRTPPVDNEVA